MLRLEAKALQYLCRAVQQGLHETLPLECTCAIEWTSTSASSSPVSSAVVCACTTAAPLLSKAFGKATGWNMVPVLREYTASPQPRATWAGGLHVLPAEVERLTQLVVGASRAFGLQVAQMMVVLLFVTRMLGPHHDTQPLSSGLAAGLPLNTI